MKFDRLEADDCVALTCKQILEKSKLQQQKATADYLSYFNKIDLKLKTSLSTDEWFHLYNDLVDWQIKFDKYKDIGLKSVLSDQMQSCNKEFVNFFLSNYQGWLNSSHRPLFPNDIIEHVVFPKLASNEKICLLVVDCMRLDHFKSIMPLLKNFYLLKI